MDALVWMFLPLFTASGSALLAFLIMQARMEVAIARERETLAQANATIQAGEKLLQERVKAAEEEARRRSFDDLMADMRIEERHYVKESKSLFMNRKSMVLQERMFFRNIPLSNWVSHEFPVEEGTDLPSLAKACSVFTSGALAEAARETSRLLPS
ncbi:MAG: hypothetical protein KIT09_27025 [Bryobacteraceae bacterium]|nr:hypothetical protein [Bryobacteraceae bacterium]